MVLNAGWLMFWRNEIGDGLYTFSGRLLRSGRGTDSRFVGQLPGLTLAWEPRRGLSILGHRVGIYRWAIHPRDRRPSEVSSSDSARPTASRVDDGIHNRVGCGTCRARQSGHRTTGAAGRRAGVSSTGSNASLPARLAHQAMKAPACSHRESGARFILLRFATHPHLQTWRESSDYVSLLEKRMIQRRERARTGAVGTRDLVHPPRPSDADLASSRNGRWPCSRGQAYFRSQAQWVFSWDRSHFRPWCVLRCPLPFLSPC